MRNANQPAREVFLGIEAGATHTVAVAVANGEPAGRMERGPANIRLVSDAELVRLLRDISKVMPRPCSIAIGMAGARTESDRERIRRAAGKVWDRTPCYATNDLETALMAALQPVQPRDRARVLILSGTGSCCFGRAADGRTAKMGGWGHILGDKGSGFEIGLRALKAVVYYYDKDGEWSLLGQRILRVLQLNEPDELIGWVQTASKTEIAALAIEVFQAAAKQEKIARDILQGAASGLARDAAACAARLTERSAPVEFVLAGSVLLKQERFAQQVGRELKRLWPKATISPLKRESVWGAVALAMAHYKAPHQGLQSSDTKRGIAGSSLAHSPSGKPLRGQYPTGSEAPLPEMLMSPTEQRNPRSMNLDKLSLREGIELMLNEDEKVPAAILKQRKNIEQAIRMVVSAFQRGGRLFYVGAGTSGRLGVLDASECPPTFNVPPDLVQGIISGGQRALWQAVEGAEDDVGAGARAVQHRSVGKKDVLLGIAASGRTPFVWGALNEAKRRKAKTVLLCFNPNLDIPDPQAPDLVIAPNVGPEILTGSTRLKAGTATKLILNILTTLAMLRTGKVLSNLMIDVRPTNSKLRDRATRIVQELTGRGYSVARAALEKSRWQIRVACQRLGTTDAHR